jgi:deoxyribonuclease-4
MIKMIRIGQAGIPLSCKGRTNKDGLKYTKNVLNLNAMEIQFVRSLYIMEEEEAVFMKDFAKENDVELYVHAPYYTNFAGDEEEVKMSFEKILVAGRISNMMSAKIVVIHPGFYGNQSPAETKKKIIKNMRKLHNLFKKEGIKTKIGIETMGKQKVFGSLDEVVDVCKKVKGVIPTIDIGHIHARCNGCLKKKEDFEEIFKKLKPLKLKHYFIHLTGVLYENGSEYHHIPIKKGDMPIDPLIELILDNKYNVTLISESPLLEHDAVYIRLQVEKALQRRTGLEEVDYREFPAVLKK